MSSNLKKIGKKQKQAQQIAGLLNTLTPGIQQMQERVQQITDLEPHLLKLQAEWDEVLRGIRHDIASLQVRVEQVRSVILVLMHEVKDPASMTLEEYLALADELDEKYERAGRDE